MTLGNSPQPLTRRQLRELAREQEPAAADAAGPDDTSAPAPDDAASDHTAPNHTAPDDTAPDDTAPTPHSRHTGAPAADPIDSAVDHTVDSAVEPTVEPTVGTAAAPAPTPAPGSPAVPDPGRTLTRRELRALQVAASLGADDSSADDSSADDTEAGAEAHATTAAAVAPEPRSASAEKPATAEPVTAEPVTPQPVTAASAAAEPATEPAAAGLRPPLGHWSVDREDSVHHGDVHHGDVHHGDAHHGDSFDDLVGRGIAAGGIPTTTNALILPAIPRQGTAGPITSTGEIMITGSLDLPRSLGATGQLPNLFDSSEMDRMLDQLDEGGHHNDVAPVSASRAVSTHTSTRGVMTPPRKRGASLPTVLAITAAVLAIGVLSLFVIGYAFNIY